MEVKDFKYKNQTETSKLTYSCFFTKLEINEGGEIDEVTVNGEFENFRTYKLESKLKYRLVIKLE